MAPAKSISEETVRKFWAVVSVAVALCAGATVWATRVSASIDRIEERALEDHQSLHDIVREVRLLREAMIRAGTALPPKED